MADSWRTPAVVLGCATAIMLLSFGIRQTYGLFLTPISAEFGWNRGVFSFAVALQSLIWGGAQPFLGALADRYGSAKVVAASALLYSAGLYLMAVSTTPAAMIWSTAFLTGVAMSGTSFTLLLAVIGRSAPPAKRSLYLGIGSAGGSSGQFLVVPLGQYFIGSYGWAEALMLLALVAGVMAPLSAAVAEKFDQAHAAARLQSPGQALREAGGHASYLLLTAGFFVCGFQTLFIGTHLPALLEDAHIAREMGATALALIGFFNVIGCVVWGALGHRHSKKSMLSLLYLLRSVLMTAFFLLPITNSSVVVFSSLMGLLFLGTVPLTSGIVAQIFGVRYMAMLYGIVFLSHQIGSFLGIWLGGALFDYTGSYDAIWWAAVGLGVAAALINWPIDERTVPRLAAEPVADSAAG